MFWGKNGRLRRIRKLWPSLTEPQRDALDDLVTIQVTETDPRVDAVYSVLRLLAGRSPETNTVQPG